MRWQRWVADGGCGETRRDTRTRARQTLFALCGDAGGGGGGVDCVPLADGGSGTTNANSVATMTAALRSVAATAAVS